MLAPVVAPDRYLPVVAPDDSISSSLARVTAALPGGGEARPGQVDMAQAVARALTSRRHLVVQAGTGTGKSLAYLVPAVLSGRPVVVATATNHRGTTYDSAYDHALH